jgi:hypothetical protein
VNELMTIGSHACIFFSIVNFSPASVEIKGGHLNSFLRKRVTNWLAEHGLKRQKGGDYLSYFESTHALSSVLLTRNKNPKERKSGRVTNGGPS